ncbi:hypothetical protein EVC23_003 [Rhizobium phage RHph_N3_8]|uniref:hypothetical protein n=1 Tax=Rhizobium phage RHph_N3_8 TaxID=2509748 RepID=UPI001AF267E5|nr:hypothetical protein QEJ65_gp03 [Rhizobium phage RHph_N3_8]QIG76002.1 hypothetical protein EVC23_003 [Rhizobium phage RHph_N3_8]
MKFPIGESGQVTVNELIAALLEFPPGAYVDIHSNFMQDVELIINGTVVMEG